MSVPDIEIKTSPATKSIKEDESSASGRWNMDEHNRFKEGLSIYGKDWKLIAEYVRTRTMTQVRSHAQKYFARLRKGSSSVGPKIHYSNTKSGMFTQIFCSSDHKEEFDDFRKRLQTLMMERSNLLKNAGAADGGLATENEREAIDEKIDSLTREIVESTISKDQKLFLLNTVVKVICPVYSLRSKNTLDFIQSKYPELRSSVIEAEKVEEIEEIPHSYTGHSQVEARSPVEKSNVVSVQQLNVAPVQQLNMTPVQQQNPVSSTPIVLDPVMSITRQNPVVSNSITPNLLPNIMISNPLLSPTPSVLQNKTAVPLKQPRLPAQSLSSVQPRQPPRIQQQQSTRQPLPSIQPPPRQSAYQVPPRYPPAPQKCSSRISIEQIYRELEHPTVPLPELKQQVERLAANPPLQLCIVTLRRTELVEFLKQRRLRKKSPFFKPVSVKQLSPLPVEGNYIDLDKEAVQMQHKPVAEMVSVLTGEKTGYLLPITRRQLRVPHAIMAPRASSTGTSVSLFIPLVPTQCFVCCTDFYILSEHIDEP